MKGIEQLTQALPINKSYIEELESKLYDLTAKLRQTAFREDGLIMHNQLLRRENADLVQKYKEVVNENARLERIIQSLKSNA